MIEIGLEDLLATPPRSKSKRRKVLTQTRLPFASKVSFDPLQLNPVDVFEDVQRATATMVSPFLNECDDPFGDLFWDFDTSPAPMAAKAPVPFYKTFEEMRAHCSDLQMQHMSIQELNGIIIDMSAHDKAKVKVWRRKVKNCASAKGKPERVQDNMQALANIALRFVDISEELVALPPAIQSAMIHETLAPLAFGLVRDKIAAIVDKSKPVRR